MIESIRADAVQAADRGLETLRTAEDWIAFRAAAAELRAASRVADALAIATRRANPPEQPRMAVRRRGTSYARTSAPMPEELGPAIKGCRERAGLDVAGAAKACGMRRGSYELVEAGERAMRPETAERIASAPWIDADVGTALVEGVRCGLDG